MYQDINYRELVVAVLLPPIIIGSRVTVVVGVSLDSTHFSQHKETGALVIGPKCTYT